MQDSEHIDYSMRPFRPEEVMIYKAMRLDALQKEAGMFGANYAFELTLTDDQWMDRIVNPNSACYGLFYKDELIGITGIIIDKEHPDLGHLIQSYILKPHRGKGLSNMLYKASNLASKAASARFGFKYTHREGRSWPDGSTEDILYYELSL